MKNKFPRIIYLLISFVLIFQQSGFAQVAAELNIAGRLGSLRSVFIQDKFRPLHLRYLAYDNINNNFKLLLDKGDFDKKQGQIEASTKTLLNYFFTGISLPNDAFWVNLRPDSPDNIIDPFLAQTDLGRILLEADLQLKKDTANFTAPNTPEGKEYWDRLYKKAEELFGGQSITIPTLTRPWIVPGEIIVRETPDSAYIYKATLKVMLEQDYLKDSTSYDFKDERLRQLNEYSSELIREKIIPRLTREINTARRYAALRQVYYSLILAQWFKQKFYAQPGVYSGLIDRRNLTGLTSRSPWDKQTYFKAYQDSFNKGEYNLKEQVYSLGAQTVRTYMSGGIALGQEIARSISSSAITSNKVLVADAGYLVGFSTVKTASNDAPFEVALSSRLPERSPGSSSSPVASAVTDLEPIKRLISQYLPTKYRSMFSVDNLPFHVHGEGATLAHHLQAMLNVLDNAATMDNLGGYKKVLVAPENRKFFELFILLHDIGKGRIVPQTIIEEGKPLQLYPKHETESVAMLMEDPQLGAELENRDILIEVIRLHGALYGISKDPVNAETFRGFINTNNIDSSKLDVIIPLLIAADILDVHATYRVDSWEERPLNFAKGYEEFLNISSFSPSASSPVNYFDADQNKAMELLRNDPLAWVIFSDMFKLGLKNDYYGRDIADVFIADAIRISKGALAGHQGTGFRLGERSDEIAMVLPGSMQESEVRGMLQSIQEQIRKEYLGYAIGRLPDGLADKLRSSPKVRAAQRTIRENRRGGTEFITTVFFVKDSDDTDGRLTLDRILRGTAQAAGQGEIEAILPPYLPAGAARLRGQGDLENKLEYSLREAEIFQRVAKQAGQMAGVERLSPRPQISEGARLNDSAFSGLDSYIRGYEQATQPLREFVKARYGDNAAKQVQIDNGYAAFLRQNLYVILEYAIEKARAADNLMLAVRGPPDNFYIVSASKGKWQVTLVRQNILTDPGSSLEKDFLAIIEGSGRGLRSPGKYPFKVVNDFDELGHYFGNQLIKLDNVNLLDAFNEQSAQAGGILEKPSLNAALNKAGRGINSLLSRNGFAFSVSFEAISVTSDDFAQDINRPAAAISAAALGVIEKLNTSRKTAMIPANSGTFYNEYKNRWQQVEEEIALISAKRNTNARLGLQEAYSDIATPIQASSSPAVSGYDGIESELASGLLSPRTVNRLRKLILPELWERRNQLSLPGFQEMIYPARADDFTSASALSQFALIKDDLVRLIREKEGKAEYSFNVYQIGLGEKPEETRRVIDTFKQAFTEAVDISAAGKWTLDLTGIDLNKDAVNNANLISSELIIPGVKVNTRFVLANVLDRQRLERLIDQKARADYIFYRRVTYPNELANKGWLALNTLENGNIQDWEDLLNIYVSLRNVMLSFAKEGSRFVVEPLEDKADKRILNLPGALPLSENNLYSGIYRVDNAQGIKQAGFAEFLRAQPGSATLPLVTELLKERIKESRDGKITFREFMDISLYSENGYYSAGRVGLGAETETAADFGTFPEIAPLTFGYGAAEQIAQMWENMGRPERFQIIEMGAGNGTWAYRIMEYLKQRHKELFGALEYTIVEISPGLIKRQKERLQGKGYPVEWINRSALDIKFKDVEGVFISNELPDAFSVHKVKKDAAGRIKEVYVGYADGQFKEELGEVSDARINDYISMLKVARGNEYVDAALSGKGLAVNLDMWKWQEALYNSLKKGYVITVDTGFNSEALDKIDGQEPPLRVYSVKYDRKDQIDNPEQYMYNFPGQVDIISDVDFKLLAQMGAGLNNGRGFRQEGITNQYKFFSNIYGQRKELNTLANDIWDPEVLHDDVFYVLIQSKGELPKTDLIGLRQAASSAVQEAGLIRKQGASLGLAQAFSRRVIIVGDIHGDLEGLQQDLRDAGLADTDGNWTGGKALLIQMGDMIDRGELSLETYRYLSDLRAKARLQGGDVKILLGNHEYMFLLGVAGDSRQLNNWVNNLGGGRLKSVLLGVITSAGIGAARRMILTDGTDDFTKLKELYQGLSADIKKGDIQAAYAESGVLFVHGGINTKNKHGSSAKDEADFLNRQLAARNFEAIQDALQNRFGYDIDGENLDYLQIVAHTPALKEGAEVEISANGKVVNVDVGHWQGYGGNRGYAEINANRLQAYALVKKGAVSSVITEGAKILKDMQERLKDMVLVDPERKNEEYKLSVDDSRMAQMQAIQISLVRVKDGSRSLSPALELAITKEGKLSFSIFLNAVVFGGDDAISNLSEKGFGAAMLARAGEAVPGGTALKIYVSNADTIDAMSDGKRLDFAKFAQTPIGKLLGVMRFGNFSFEDKDVVIDARGERVIAFSVSAVKIQPASSAAEDLRKGGIDLRSLPIIRQPVLIKPGVNINGPVPVPLAELDKELLQIRNMLAAGITPSSQRIKEYLESCCQRQGYSAQTDKILSCIADILRIEEERVAQTDPALKEILALLESEKSAKELQAALTQVTVLEKQKH